MAQIDSSQLHANTIVTDAAKGIKDLIRLRLISGYTLILVSLIGVLGGDWDIQWHATIGRDRTFTPPHDMILIGIALAGIVALITILIETSWLGRQRELRKYGTDFLGILHSSLGSYLIGFGAVCSAVAFPLDTYWHSLYGIDVSLWAPFHTMIYMGGILGGFGTVYLLVSAAHLSEMQQHRGMTIVSYAGVVAALGILLSKFSTFITPSLLGMSLHFSSVTINLFPFLTAFAVVFICMLAVRLLPWTGAATMVMIAFILLWLLVSMFVPPMMTLLVQAEHETYLARASRIGSLIIPLLGQTPVLLLVSLSVDSVAWLGRRGQWKPAAQRTWILVAAAVSMFLVTGLILTQRGLRGQAIQGGRAGASGILLLVLSLLLAIPGSLLGDWLSLMLSRVLQTLRR